MLSLGLSLSIQQPASKFLRTGANLFFSDYEARVLADGGTVESERCFAAALYYLGVRSVYDYTEFLLDRMYADGASFDGVTNTAITKVWNQMAQDWETSTDVWNVIEYGNIDLFLPCFNKSFFSINV